MEDSESLLSNPELDAMITRLKRREYLSKSEVKALCQSAKEVLGDEQNMHDVPAPARLCASLASETWR